MDIRFVPLELPREAQALTDWLVAGEWPFHGNLRLTPEKVESLLAERYFDGSNHRTFWIVGPEDERVGYIRLFDLEDIPEGSPLFDIRLSARARGAGIGTKAVGWLTSYLFENWPELERIDATTRHDNLAMRRVFRKCNYTKEGHHRRAWRSADGKRYDAIYYGILREDWRTGRVTPVPWNDEE